MVPWFQHVPTLKFGHPTSFSSKPPPWPHHQDTVQSNTRRRSRGRPRAWWSPERPPRWDWDAPPCHVQRQFQKGRFLKRWWGRPPTSPGISLPHQFQHWKDDRGGENGHGVQRSPSDRVGPDSILRIDLDSPRSGDYTTMAANSIIGTLNSLWTPQQLLCDWVCPIRILSVASNSRQFFKQTCQWINDFKPSKMAMSQMPGSLGTSTPK